MNNNCKETNIIDTQKQNKEDYEVEKEELFEGINKNVITEKEQENIYPNCYHNIPYSTNKLGLVTVHHDYPEIPLMIQNIFANIAAESKVNTRATHLIQLPSKLSLHNWM